MSFNWSRAPNTTGVDYTMACLLTKALPNDAEFKNNKIVTQEE